MRIAVVGCGGIAAAHLTGYLAAGARVTLLADPRTEAAQRLAERCPGARIVADARAAIASGEVDAISICTPPACHEDLAVHALAHGVHVLCEKPLAHDLEAARRIAAAAARSPATAMIAFRHRFLPAVQEIARILASGRIGTPVLLRNFFGCRAAWLAGTWFQRRSAAGGGTIVDTSSHAIDLFRHLLGEIVDCQALAHSHQDIEVEDVSVVTVKGVDGALGALSASWVAGSPEATISVIGRDGRVDFDYDAPDAVVVRSGTGAPERIAVRASDGFCEEIAHFLAAARGEQRCAVPLTEGLRAQEIIERCYRQLAALPLSA